MGKYMNRSRIGKLFDPHFYLFNFRAYREIIDKDRAFNATFRNGSNEMSRQEEKTVEFKTVKLYRKCQTNEDNIWGYIYRKRLKRNALKVGIEFLGNVQIGAGFIIGHWGRIVINGSAVFGEEIMLTHGVTIGRDIRGARAGVPKFGNKICIRTNSTVVGGITIGDDVLIAPNTFVNFDVPSHSVVIGNPATIHFKMDATKGHLGKLYEE